MKAVRRIRVSSKGQVVLPSAIRRSKGWTTGEELVVEETPDAVILRRASPFKPTRPEDVAGSLKYDGPPISIEDMHKGVDEMFREQHARGRY